MTEKVNHPAYYNRGTMEVIDIIKAVLSYHPGLVPHRAWELGTVVKYLCRFGGKDDTVQELDKAIWYLTYLRDDIKEAEQ